MLKDTLKRFRLYAGLNDLIKTVKNQIRERKEMREWLKRGKPAPPPHAVKRGIIKHFLQKCPARIFIETGTYRGDMIKAMSGFFKEIYSIELDEELYRNAVQRFARYPHIEIVKGDSAERLPAILNGIHEPAFFWLDGHYSGEFTAKGTVDTPILQELNAIFNHPVKNHTILIDDARCFVGEHDYPSLGQLRSFVLGNRPDLSFEVEDDVIRILPAASYREKSR